MSIDILVVDDEADIRDLISGILEDEGFSPRTAANSDGVFKALRERVPALIVLDVWLQNSAMDGIEILQEIKKVHPELPVVIISGHGTIETAVAAIKKGAYDFIEKPFNADRLVLVINRALESARLKRENVELRERGPDWGLIGSSTAINSLRAVIDRVARQDDEARRVVVRVLDRLLEDVENHRPRFRILGPIIFDGEVDATVTGKLSLHLFCAVHLGSDGFDVRLQTRIFLESILGLRQMFSRLCKTIFFL